MTDSTKRRPFTDEDNCRLVGHRVEVIWSATTGEAMNLVCDTCGRLWDVGNGRGGVEDSAGSRLVFDLGEPLALYTNSAQSEAGGPAVKVRFEGAGGDGTCVLDEYMAAQLSRRLQARGGEG